MVGHDAPNALSKQYRALVDAIAEKPVVTRSADDIEMDRRIIGQLVTELREALSKIRELEERLRESREG